jgi:YtkA-like
VTSRHLLGNLLAVLAALALGTLLALAIVVGARFVVGERAAPAATTPREQAAGAPDRRPLDIRVRTRNLGSLRVGVRARVAVNGSALMRAGAVATADMTEMPGAHTTAPVQMREVPGRPGRYSAEIGLPMPGTYDVKVQVASPIAGEATERLSMGVVNRP